MREIEIPLPANEKTKSAPEIFEAALIAENLTVTLKTGLAQYPGSVHWHIKRGKARGVLEATWWEAQNRFWLKVAAGRTADWIEDAAARLKARFEREL